MLKNSMEDFRMEFLKKSAKEYFEIVTKLPGSLSGGIS